MILDRPNRRKIKILGTEYSIIVEHETDNEKYENCDGYIDNTVREIHIAIMKDDEREDIIEFRKSVVRHEIIHGFLWESGLDVCSFQQAGGWAKNEEMVDFFAIQYPKMNKVFEELGI